MAREDRNNVEADQYFDDPEDSHESSKTRHSRFLVALTVLTFGLLGNTLAGNINLSSNSPKEFGQGLLQTVSCDPDGVYINPKNEMTGSDRGSDLRLASITISGISSSCNGQKFTLRVYDNSSSTPLLTSRYLREITFFYSSASSQTSSEYEISNANNAVTIKPVIPMTLASELAKFTLESGGITPELSGILDPGFGAPGVFSNSGGRSDTCSRIVNDGSGNIYSICKSRLGLDWQGLVTKYQKNGAPDSNFAASGVLRITNNGTQLIDAALDRVGNIYLAFQIMGASQAVEIQRFNISGTLDNTFGNSGKITYSSPAGNRSSVGKILLDKNEKILLAGHTCNDTQGTCNPFVARFNYNGSLDQTFGTNGSTSIATSDTVYGNSMLLDSKGRVYVNGDSANGTIGDVYLFRLLSDGSRDASFGVNGQVMFDFGSIDESALDMELNPNGGVFLAGSTKISSQDKMLVASVKENGSLDATFGNSGWTTVSPDSSLPFWATSIAVTNSGQIYINGMDMDSSGSARKGYVSRLTKSGILDTSFGSNGFLQISFTSGGTELVNAVSLTQEGRLVVVGFTGLLSSPLVGYTALVK